MRNFLLLFIFFFVGCSPFKDLNTIDINKDFQKEFRQYKKEYRKEILKDPQDWDIVLDPIEAVPTDVITTRALAVTNWGEQMLLPNNLRERVQNECTFPVVIKVFDTGGKWTHPDLQDGQLPGEVYTGESTPEDGNGHSTHVWGIIGGRDFGLAWELVETGKVKGKPIKVLTNGGTGSFSWIINAQKSNFAEDEELKDDGVAVIYSGSLGGGSNIVQGLDDEMKRAIDAGGRYFFYAAGNNGRYVEYPGKSQYTNAVAALTQSLNKASFSSPGPEVDYAKPGVSIYSTWLDGKYASLSGTSMATPFMSAAAAIALSKWGMERLPNHYALRSYLADVASYLSAVDQRNDNTGWGITYIAAILDTEPGKAPDEPDPDPDPDPEPEPGPVRPYPVDYTFDINEPLTMVWRPQGGKDAIMEIPHLRFKLSNQKRPFDVVEAEINALVTDYFRNRGLVLLPHHDQYDASYWAIRFLYMIKFKEVEIETLEVISQDKKTKSIIYRSDIMENLFERRNVPAVDTKTGRMLVTPKQFFTPVQQGVYTYEIE